MQAHMQSLCELKKPPKEGGMIGKWYEFFVHIQLQAARLGEMCVVLNTGVWTSH